jgi:iron complex outermembrane receptor protein
VEVLKGPQGTLFGRNSAGGAIAVISNEPGQDVEAEGRVKLGKFGRADAEAILNLPINDSLAARLAVVRRGSEGWAENTATGKKSGGDKDWATRLSLRKDFDGAKLIFAWEHENMEQYGRPAFGVIKNPSLLGGYTGVYNATYTANFVNPLTASLADDQQGSEGRLFDGATLRFEMPLAGMTFSSVSAYRRFTTHNLTDNDGGASANLSLTTQDAKRANSFQQEFKLSGSGDKLDWVAGVSAYQNDESQLTGAYVTTGTIDTLSRFAGGQPNFALLFGGLAAAGVAGISADSVFSWDESHYSHVKTKSASVYGDTIWHLTPATNVTVGLRYTFDRKTMTWYVPGRVSPALDDFLARYGALAGLSASSFPSNVVFATAAQLASSPVTRSKDWTDLSPRLVLDHKLKPGTMLYTSLSRGYQAGGFNIFTPPNPASATKAGQDPSFEPERLTNLEAGLKISLPELRASVNAALFAYKFKNMQDIQLYSVGTVPTYNVVSSDQKAHGLDLDGRIAITPRVTVFGGVELIDQSYTRYQRLDAAGDISLDLGGQPVGTPYLTAMAGVNLNWSAPGGRANLNFQGTHASAHRCNSDTAALSCLTTATLKTGTATSKFDLRLGWDSADARYGVALIVNNLFDQRYLMTLAGQTAQYGAPYSNITPPRSFGVEFRARM